MVKKMLLKIKQSIWLYPVLYSLISIILVVAVLMVDMRVIFEPEKVLPEIMFTRIDLAQTILGNIAGSLITMTTFTFSTTMVVLTMYTSEYSPRTIENFLNDKKTMKILGIFMGGFIYSILSLLFMRENLSDYGVISASVGVLYSIVCLAYFAIFINHVGNLIQANNLIERLYRESKSNIEGYKKSLSKANVEKKLDCGDYTHGVSIKSRDSGYIQLADKEELIAIAKELDAIVLMEKVIGQFVTSDSEILKVYLKGQAEVDKEIRDKLLSAIVIGNNRNEFQDFDFSVQKIVEIALRAISPGINDPNTANHCIRILGELLSNLSDTEFGYMVFLDDNGSSVIFEAISFEKELYFTFYQIVHYGKNDVSVIISIYKSLRFMAKKASWENKVVINDFVDYVYRHLGDNLRQGLDHEMILAEMEDVLNI